MKNRIVYTFILALCFLTGLLKTSASAEVIMPERWHALMNLISKEEQTIRSLDRISPNLKYRLLELESEKMDLIKQRENKVFLSDSPEAIQKNGRDYYFRQSMSMEAQARRMGLGIIREVPRFIHNPNIYYTLALNSRDYGKNEHTEAFLLEALKLSDERTPVIYNVRVALAEHYYNDNQHEKAITLYNHVLRNLGDEWHTKHLYNAAWCYLKVQDLNRGIELLVRSHDLGLTSRYISMKEQVLESAQAFYVLAERVEEGIEFYIKNAENPSPYLIRMAHRTAERGEFNSTQNIITKNISLAKENQQWSSLFDIYLQQLDIYRNFKRYELHMETAQNIEELDKQHPMSEGQREEAIRKITELVGYQQIRLTNNAKVRQTNYDPNLLKSVIKYFDILAAIDPPNSDRYAYFQGESFFAIRQYRNAGLAYRKALESSKADHQEADEREDLRRRILDALLAVIEFGDLKGEEKENITIYTFTNYLHYWPVDDKSRLIYRSLFNLYRQKNEVNNSLQVLHRYQLHYSDESNREIQRAMLTQIIDGYIESKDSDQLALWINRLGQGYLNYSSEYIERATVILGQILFENYSLMANQGNVHKAIEGYKEVFADERYPTQIKARASLQIALLDLELNHQEDSYKWLSISLEKMDYAEKLELIPRLVTMHEIYFLKQNYKLSYSLADKLIEIFCAEAFPQKPALVKNSVAFKLLEGESQAALNGLSRSRACSPTGNANNDIQLTQEIISSTLGHFLQNRMYREFFSLYNQLKTSTLINDSIRTAFHSGIVDAYWDSFVTRNRSIQESTLKEMERLVAHPINDAQKEMKLILDYRNFTGKYRTNPFKAFSRPEVYDDDLFQNELEYNFNVFNELSNQADKFIALAHPEITLQVTSLMVNFSSYFAELVIRHRPQGMPEEFMQSFSSAMADISAQIRAQGMSYQGLAQEFINKHTLLAHSNYLHSYENELREQFSWAYSSPSYAIPMTSMGGRHD